MPEPILQTTGALLTLVGELQTALSRSDKHLRVHDEIVSALRQIYFTPTRTLAVLAVLAEGERPDAALAQQTIFDFNDAEFRVLRSLEVLLQMEDRREVSLRTGRILGEIAYGKRNLRREIQDLLNEAITYDRPVDPAQAKAALAGVKALNSAIEAIEAAYNWRAGAI